MFARIHLIIIFLLYIAAAPIAAALEAAAAKIDITDYDAGRVNDPAYAKALVLKDGGTLAALITVDAVAIGTIGRIDEAFLETVRHALQTNLAIPPEHVFINASHCHAVVRTDTADLVIRAVNDAAAKLTAVNVGEGAGHEDGISENRRLKMKDGSEIDMRRAYPLPPSDQVAAAGPIDPQIGLLRIDRADGTPLAVVYNFACHPIMNPPDRGSSADYPGYASAVIESSLGHDAIALFIQGCGGDINPIRYKEAAQPPDAEPLGNRIGLSAMRALLDIETKSGATLNAVRHFIDLPYAADIDPRIEELEAERMRALESLQGTNIDFESFLPLFIRMRAVPEAPSHHAQSKLNDQQLGRDALDLFDTANKADAETYVQNILIMEHLIRLNTNLAILQQHREELRNVDGPLRVEIGGLRIGNFRLVMFPGELSAQIGLNIKAAAPEHAYIAGYTNGYIYYTPTAEQRRNTGYAQEDCDSIVAPEWQQVFEEAAMRVLGEL